MKPKKDLNLSKMNFKSQRMFHGPLLKATEIIFARKSYQIILKVEALKRVITQTLSVLIS